jgi:hypothetical protein
MLWRQKEDETRQTGYTNGHYAVGYSVREDLERETPCIGAQAHHWLRIHTYCDLCTYDLLQCTIP